MVLKNHLLLSLIMLFGLLGSTRVVGQVLRYETDVSSPHFGQVVVENLSTDQNRFISRQQPAQWADLLKVYVGKQPRSDNQPAILGKYTHKGTTLRFRPRFPFEPNMSYCAILHIDSSVHLSFTPKGTVENKPSTVDSIYPSGPLIPANVLRFYIYFTSPMREDHPYDHINIINRQGDTLKNVFYPADPALWSSDFKRLTVMLDPGRIKRGLPSHNQWGLALNPGEKYILVVGKDLLDQHGTSMVGPVRHSIIIGEEDHKSPQLNAWKLEHPAAHSYHPLLIHFDEPMDQSQCLRWISIKKGSQEVQGLLELIKGEESASFTPSVPWEQGEYQLQVYNNLEDRSGNSLRKTFEVQVNQSQTVDPIGWESISFTIE